MTHAVSPTHSPPALKRSEPTSTIFYNRLYVFPVCCPVPAIGPQAATPRLMFPSMDRVGSRRFHSTYAISQTQLWTSKVHFNNSS